MSPAPFLMTGSDFGGVQVAAQFAGHLCWPPGRVAGAGGDCGGEGKGQPAENGAPERPRVLRPVCQGHLGVHQHRTQGAGEAAQGEGEQAGAGRCYRTSSRGLEQGSNLRAPQTLHTPQDYVALQKWEFRGYEDTKHSAEKHQRQLHRLARRVTEVYKQPAAASIARTLASSGQAQMSPADAVAVPAGPAIPAPALAPPAAHSPTTVTTHDGSTQAAALRANADQLANAVHEIASVIVDRLADLRKDTQRGHIARKQLALKELLEQLAALGISKSELAVPPECRTTLSYFVQVRVQQ